jgi:hypothetical protein
MFYAATAATPRMQYPASWAANLNDAVLSLTGYDR